MSVTKSVCSIYLLCNLRHAYLRESYVMDNIVYIFTTEPKKFNTVNLKLLAVRGLILIKIIIWALLYPGILVALSPEVLLYEAIKT